MNRAMRMESQRHIGYAMVRVFLFVVLCVPQNAQAARVGPDHIADMVEELLPSVVNISTTQKMPQAEAPFSDLQIPDFGPQNPLNDLKQLFEQFQHYGELFNKPREANSLGSGFVVDAEGYIVTNHHVIADAQEVMVRFSDNTEVEAKVVGQDSKTDLALLKIEPSKKLKPVRFGNSDKARVGEWVIAIGNPFGLGGSVSAGIISARARDIHAGPFDDFIQTDAAINRGNSGGPMFNMAGEVIGINSAIFTPTGGNIGIGFAIPSMMAMPVIEQLKSSGAVQRAWLGVKIQSVTEDIAESLGLSDVQGALVVDVTAGSPAERAGLRTGDIIMQYNGHEVTEMRRFPRMVADTQVGESVEIVVWRQGKEKELTAKLGDSKRVDMQALNRSRHPLARPEPAEDVKVAGMVLEPLTDEFRKKWEMGRGHTGLVVATIDRSAEAWERGVRHHDVIMMVNEMPVSSVADFRALIKKAKANGKSYVLVRLWREGQTQFVTLPTE